MKKLLVCFTSILAILSLCAFNNKENVRIVMVGDDLLHTPVYSQGLQSDGSYDMSNIFVNTKDYIKSADIAIINQETIFTADKNNISSYPQFGSPLETGKAIVDAGFDVVAHATNHSADKKKQGIIDTCAFWDENYPDIKYLGIHDDPSDSDISYITKNGITFSFVNYTYGLNGLEGYIKDTPYMVDLLSNNDIEETMKRAVETSQVRIAILHAGTEYVYEPTQYQKDQIERFIDLGAQIVICMHPHVVEPYGIVTTKNNNTGLVYYSLGNFVSAQDEYPRVLGGMADFTVTKEINNGETKIYISSYTMTPLITHQERNNYTTYFLDNYPKELESRHILTKKGFSIENLRKLWEEIMKNNPQRIENLEIYSAKKNVTTLDFLFFAKTLNS